MTASRRAVVGLLLLVMTTLLLGTSTATPSPSPSPRLGPASEPNPDALLLWAVVLFIVGTTSLVVLLVGRRQFLG